MSNFLEKQHPGVKLDPDLINNESELLLSHWKTHQNGQGWNSRLQRKKYSETFQDKMIAE